VCSTQTADALERDHGGIECVELLGHASIITTERYDNQKLQNLQAAAARLERGETFDPGPREASSPSLCQLFVKSEGDQAEDDQANRVRERATNAKDEEDLADWLGGSDSNPDNVVQRAVHGCPCAPVRAVSLGVSRHHLASASGDFGALPCKTSHRVSWSQSRVTLSGRKALQRVLSINTADDSFGERTLKN
jgi:hypothetical protein